MLVIPAIDLKGGKVVRLVQGKPEEETIYSANPVEIAKMWEEKGAKLLHIVDLDGAISGKLENSGKVKEIISAVKIPVQLGGGIRDLKTVKGAFDIGVTRIIIGTKAAIDPNFIRAVTAQFKEKVIVSIDAKGGNVAIWGWQQMTEYSAVTLAQEMKQIGVQELVYTDITRDGMLEGPNFDAIRNFAQAIKMKVIASGGVSSLEDIKKLVPCSQLGVVGIIIGKALYTQDIKLEEAIEVAKEISTSTPTPGAQTRRFPPRSDVKLY
ncbi:MAG: 1-(5-phosphoribosyl)-5-[(5-phosphoribosylamino)methylideneamino]imidazole-4-carboxamide isomerase [Nitrospirota bacterium]